MAESTPTQADIRATIVHMQNLARADEANLAKAHDDVASTQAALAAAIGKLTQATRQIDAKQREVDALQTDRDRLKTELDAASSKLWWYRLHWWGAWIMLGLGLLACLAFAFLKFTGRLALAGAAVAAKIP